MLIVRPTGDVSENSVVIEGAIGVSKGLNNDVNSSSDVTPSDFPSIALPECWANTEHVEEIGFPADDGAVR